MQFTIIILFCYGLLHVATADDLLELGCATDETCMQFERSKCRDSHCYCTAPDSDKHVPCKPKDHKLSNIIGGPCTAEHRCAQQYAECDAKTQQCHCSAGYIPSLDRRRCLPQMVPLQGQCELESQCQAMDKSAVCQGSQHRCLCKDHFQPHEGRCVSTLAVSCSNDTSCKQLDAFCLPQLSKCACEAGFVHNSNMSSCMPSAFYGASCTTDAQCQVTLGLASSCSNNTCTCNAKHYPRTQITNTSSTTSTSCEPIVAFGTTCRRDEDCQQQESHMVCKYAECACQEHYAVVDNERCVLSTSGSAANQELSTLLIRLLMTAQIFWLIYSRI